MMKKVLFMLCGIITFVLGTIGIFVPLLPTTPFYLATAFFWVRSSSRLHQYLIKSEHYQKYVQDMMINRNMSVKQRIKMALGLFVIMVIPFALIDNWLMRSCLILVFLGHLIFLRFYFKQKS